MQHQRQRYLGGSNVKDLSRERARLAAAKADIAEMERQQMLGHLVPERELREAVVAAAQTCRTRILGIPAKVAHASYRLGLQPSRRPSENSPTPSEEDRYLPLVRYDGQRH